MPLIGHDRPLTVASDRSLQDCRWTGKRGPGSDGRGGDRDRAVAGLQRASRAEGHHFGAAGRGVLGRVHIGKRLPPWFPERRFGVGQATLLTLVGD